MEPELDQRTYEFDGTSFNRFRRIHSADVCTVHSSEMVSV